jgi:hypothetical protein
LYIRLPKISKLKPRKDGTTVISFDYLIDNFTADELITHDSLSKKIGNDKIKKIKVISGRKKIVKRKADNSILFSKNIKDILNNA